MGTRTEIAWTDHTMNPWLGCLEVSPGCDHCLPGS
jgi:protein gp37